MEIDWSSRGRTMKPLKTNDGLTSNQGEKRRPGVVGFSMGAATILLFAVGSASIEVKAQSKDQVDRINRWFDEQKKRKFEIQKPGEIQKAGEIQIPRGMQAIKTYDEKCKRRLVVTTDTLFEFDKSNLNKDATETLKVLGPLIVKQGKHPIQIEGHTDAIGSFEYNQALSEKRAQSVREWLLKNSFVTAQTTVVGYGKNRPIAANYNRDGSDNPEGRRLNRRVEIVIDTCAKLKDPATAAAEAAAKKSQEAAGGSPPGASNATPPGASNATPPGPSNSAHSNSSNTDQANPPAAQEGSP